MNVSHILATRRTKVVTIEPERLVREAVQSLVGHSIGALVVVDAGGRIVGIVSERDVVRAAAANETIFDHPVSEIMTRRVIVGLPHDEVMAVANTMLERRIRHLPIVDQDRLIGIISIGDVLKTQRDAYRGEIDTLETQILADEKE